MDMNAMTPKQHHYYFLRHAKSPHLSLAGVQTLTETSENEKLTEEDKLL